MNESFKRPLKPASYITLCAKKWYPFYILNTMYLYLLNNKSLS